MHTAGVLAQRFGTLDEVMAASEEELRQVDEVGPTVARGVVAYFNDDQNRRMIEEIRQVGVKLSNPYAEGGARPLDGLTFVFTGELDRWRRDQVKRYVEQLGGRATSSVSGETDHVVAGPGAGSKLDEARQRGISVLDEQEFVQLVKEHQES